MNLNTLGWNEFFANSLKANTQVARVAVQYKNQYLLYSEDGELLAQIAGKLYHKAEQGQLPVVGDWVSITKIENENKAVIAEVLPRKSCFSRKVAGETTTEQIIAANIDTTFLVMGLDRDFNFRRLERLLLLSWQSGSNAVIVLNKADLCSDIEQKLMEIESISMGVPVVVTSAINEQGLQELKSFIKPGETVALIGSSGIGKSTLVNKLTGRPVQKVQEVRQFKDRGKHTTSHRELVLLPTGGLVIDTPGMRELQLWAEEESLSTTFEDVEAIANECQFRDCLHDVEPNCAILKAIDEGKLDFRRFRNYQKMQRELRFMERKKNQKARIAEQEKWRKITKMMRKNKKNLW